MHEHCQNKFTLNQEQKSIVNFTGDRKFLRQHTPSADNKESSWGTSFWY